MGLQGTLQDFGVLETFQLIALQQKTGTLEIAIRGDAQGFVFEGGLLLYAHEVPLKEDSRLVRLLLEAGYLSVEEVKAWLSVADGQQGNPLDLLPRFAHMTQDELSETYEWYLQTLLDHVLAWKRGRFQFLSGRVGVPPKMAGPWKVEGLLMESMRRLDEVADLRETELPPGLVPKKVPGAQEPGERIERAVLALVDGSRSLQQIASRSQIAAYDIWQAVRRMRDRGLLRMAEWVPTGPWVERLWRRRSRLHSALNAAVALLAFAGVSVGVHALLRMVPPPWPVAAESSFLSEQTQASRAAFETAELLEAYRIRHGRYPAAMTQLVEDGLVSAQRARCLERLLPAWRVVDGGAHYVWTSFPATASRKTQ